MHPRRSYRIFAPVNRAILLISTLMAGFGGTTSAAIWGFGPPSNVVADVSPNLPKYELRRIGIIAFVNQSGTPDMAAVITRACDVCTRVSRCPGW
jgi:hypothetical protein